MTAQLSPTPIFKGWDNNGFPLALGFLTTYAAGTTAPQATYVDSTQTTQNTNPIRLNFRGECALWLNPLLSYKFLLTDAAGNTIPGWPVDNIQGAIGVASNIVPSITNTFTLGTPTITFANAYFGPNGAAAFDPVSGNIGYYARTAAEIAAGVTPTNFAYPPGVAYRYAGNSFDLAVAQMEKTGAPAVSSQGGMAIYGQVGGSSLPHPTAQLILVNSPTSGGHALLGLFNQSATDEAAVTYDSILSDSSQTQTTGTYSRFVNNLNPVGGPYTTVYGIHVPGYTVDFNLLSLWSTNSAQITGPSTASFPWNSPVPANWVNIYTNLLSNGPVVAGGLTHAYSTASASMSLEAVGSIQVGDVDGSGNTNHAIQLGYSTGGASGYIQSINNASALQPLSISASTISFTATGGLLPSQDNSYPFGSTGKRWTTIFAVTGTINTSDATQKTVRSTAITDVEKRWGAAIKGLIKAFQWNDAIAAKGADKARIHFGILAQEIEQAGLAVGIADPSRYAFLCKDPAVRPVKKMVSVQRHKSESYTEDFVTTKVVDGKHVRVVRQEERMRPMYQEVQLHDDSGAPLTLEAYERDAKGEIPPKPTGVLDENGKMTHHPKKVVKYPVMHRIAVMEAVDEEIDDVEPVLDAKGEAVWQYGIRYDQLYAFLIATVL